MRLTVIRGVALALMVAGCAQNTPEDAAFLAARKAAEEAAPAGATANTAEAISDEQDFGAVAARETIESDRERLEAQRQQYKVIEPTDLPQRKGGGAPDIVAYALSTSNLPGQAIWPRRSLQLLSYEQACALYPSPDRAQEGFLRLGGPRFDAEGLDPDGDGFACGWDPRPFRTVLQGAGAAGG